MKGRRGKSGIGQDYPTGAAHFYPPETVKQIPDHSGLPEWRERYLPSSPDDTPQGRLRNTDVDLGSGADNAADTPSSEADDTSQEGIREKFTNFLRLHRAKAPRLAEWAQEGKFSREEIEKFAQSRLSYFQILSLPESILIELRQIYADAGLIEFDVDESISPAYTIEGRAGRQTEVVPPPGIMPDAKHDLNKLADSLGLTFEQAASALTEAAKAANDPLRRARRIVRKYQRQHAKDPDFSPSREVLDAFKVINESNYPGVKAKRAAKKLAM